MADKNEVLVCRDFIEWESWLASHHGNAGGIWLLIAKKGSGKASITINEALDTALCYGWIDSQRKSYDTNHYLQRYSPRRAKSPWSKLNVERVEALIAAKRMRAPGLAEIAAAKLDGRWEAAYVPQRDVELPPDFAVALRSRPRAQKAFDTLPKTARYALLLPLLKATTPTSRAARLGKAVASLDARKSPSKRSSPIRKRT